MALDTVHCRCGSVSVVDWLAISLALAWQVVDQAGDWQCEHRKCLWFRRYVLVALQWHTVPSRCPIRYSFIAVGHNKIYLRDILMAYISLFGKNLSVCFSFSNAVLANQTRLFQNETTWPLNSTTTFIWPHIALFNQNINCRAVWLTIQQGLYKSSFSFKVSTSGDAV